MRFTRFILLCITIFLVGTGCEGTGNPNPFVGVMPSLDLQYDKASDKLERKYEAKDVIDIDKYDREEEKIDDRFEKKMSNEVARLVGTSMPCKSLDDVCTIVNEEAICYGSGSTLCYKAKVTFKEKVHFFGQFMMWDVYYLDAEGNCLVEGKQMMSPKADEVALAYDFIPGNVYDLTIAFSDYSDDPKLFQKEFAGVAVKPKK